MPIVPFKLNQNRRHHIPKMSFKVQNWPAYDASLRQRGSLMGRSSSCFEARLKARPGMKDSPGHVHAASCGGDDGLAVVPSRRLRSWKVRLLSWLGEQNADW